MHPSPAKADPAALEDYCSLQLRFAEEVAARSGWPLAETVLFYTNIHRRLGLGVAGAAVPSDLWLAYVGGIDELDHAARVARTVAYLSAAGDGSAALLPGRVGFGCFACEPPNADGMVRIHFGNREPGLDVGPLHHSRIAARRAELTEIVRFIVREHGGAARIDGGSWLYNIDAYRRLFPTAFAASRSPRSGPTSLHGLSTWGQFIDHRGVVRPAARYAFLANLPALEIQAPWRVFPYQVLFTTAPFEAFRQEFGV